MSFIAEHLAADHHRHSRSGCCIEADVEAFLRTDPAEHQREATFSPPGTKRTQIDPVRDKRPKICRFGASLLLRFRDAVQMSIRTRPDRSRIPLRRQVQRYEGAWTIGRKVFVTIDSMEVHDVDVFRGKYPVDRFAYVLVNRRKVERTCLSMYRDEFSGYL